MASHFKAAKGGSGSHKGPAQYPRLPGVKRAPLAPTPVRRGSSGTKALEAKVVDESNIGHSLARLEDLRGQVRACGVRIKGMRQRWEWRQGSGGTSASRCSIHTQRRPLLYEPLSDYRMVHM